MEEKGAGSGVSTRAPCPHESHQFLNNRASRKELRLSDVSPQGGLTFLGF